MDILKDTKATLERIRGYGNQMTNLLSRHQAHSFHDLKRVSKDTTFKSDVAALWDGILTAEAGKLSLTLILSTIAIAMGASGPPQEAGNRSAAADDLGSGRILRGAGA